MSFQRIICENCIDGEQEFSCENCLKLLPSTAFNTYSHTGKVNRKCISYYIAEVECNYGKLVNRTNLNKHLQICVQKLKQKENGTIDTIVFTDDTIITNDIRKDTETSYSLN